MDNKTFKKIFKEALIYGAKRGLTDEQSEDFAQRFILSRYVKRTDQNLYEAFVDFLRSEYGDTRILKGFSRAKGMKTSFQPIDDLLGSYEFCPALISLKIFFEKNLSESDRLIIEMKIAGCTLKEIADKMNISYGAVHYRLRRIKSVINSS